MSKGAVKVLFGVLAAFIAVGFGWGYVQGDTRIFQATPDNVPSIAVTGANTDYTLYDCLLPSPSNDSTWHVTTWPSDYDSVTWSSYYDTLTFDTRQCSRIGVWIGGDFDSLYYWLDYGIGGTWTNLQDSTLINSTVSRTWTPLTSDWTQRLWKQAWGDSILWPQLRVRLRNADMIAVFDTATGVADSSVLLQSAAADTAINMKVHIYCGD